jgi:hypothetical protein
MGKLCVKRPLSRPLGRPPCLAALLGLTLVAGCSQQDTDAMTGIGKKLAALAGDLKANLGSGWQGVYNGMGLEARVAARLHWDKSLAEATIHVKAAGAEIELKGTVHNQDQRRRALDLAETTAGVERVTDSLELGTP